MEVRTLTRDELEPAVMMGIRVFAGIGADVAADVQRQLELYPPEWYLGAYEGPELAAMMRTLPSAVHLNGGTVPIGLVSPVGSSPLYRRRGHAGAMLRQALQQMRERGQWLSALYTPHPALYRRYGWEIAADERVYSFKPKDLALNLHATQRGRLRHLKPDDWRQLAPVYEAYAAGHNGPLQREEIWWRNWVVETWAGPQETLLWETDAGVAEGYLIFQDPARPPSRHAGRFVAEELVCTSSDAYLNLLTVIGQQDIRDQAVLFAASDDPLWLLFQDAERLDVGTHYTVLLRVVDVAEAMRARPVVPGGSPVELTLGVSDRSAPWNDGVWRVRMADGATDVERVGYEAEIQLDACALASLYNGYISPTNAALAGLVRAKSASALERAERLFAVIRRPYFPDRF